MQIVFVEPWVTIDNAQEKHRLEQELYKELAPESVMTNYLCQAIARRTDCDDVLFKMCDNSADYQLAVVHLTWSGKSELPPWPTTSIFAHTEDFITNRMLSDAADYNL